MNKKLHELSFDDYEDILNNYYTSPINRINLSFEEIKEFSKRLNEKIRVPLIEATGEEKILIKIILKIEISYMTIYQMNFTN